MRNRKIRINQDSYDKVKYLISLNLTAGQLKELTKRSYGVICRIRESKDLADYIATSKEFYKARRIKYAKPANEIARVEHNTAIAEKVGVSETPIYDILVEIRNGIDTLNAYIRANGKSKGWKLF